MLVNLFNTVKSYGVPVTLREFLDLLNGLEQKFVFADWNKFYFLARTLLVKMKNILINLIEHLISISEVSKAWTTFKDVNT